MKKVLIIDDDLSLHKMLTPTLKGAGFDVESVVTGEEGLEAAVRIRPDIILLDVILPGIKGRETCRRIREQPETAGIPVIFLTMKDTPDDIEAEMEAGGQAHLTKPVNPQNLLKEISKLVKGSDAG